MAQTPHGTFDYEPTKRGATPFLALTKPFAGVTVALPSGGGAA